MTGTIAVEATDLSIGYAGRAVVDHVDFALRDRVPNAFVRVNPLGLQVSYFRVDQAFEEASR